MLEAGPARFLPFLFQYGLTTSLEDAQQAQAVNAFPNPFVDDLTIQSKEEFRYQLFSMDGQELEAGKGQGQQTVGSSLGKGMYLLKLETDAFQKSIKVVKR